MARRNLPDAEFFLPRAYVEGRKRAALLERARRGRVLHLTHGECLDGAGSDVMVRLKHGDAEVSTIYSDPAKVVDKLVAIAGARVPGEGRALLLSDVSPQRDQRGQLEAALGQLNELGWRIEWRDHHAKQWADGLLDAVRRKADLVRVSLDNDECGASLCQQDLLPQDPFAKELGAVVRDIDLWLRKDPRSLVLTDARHGLGSEAFVQAMLRARGDIVPSDVRRAAAAYREEFDRDVRAALAAARVVQGKHKVGVVYGDFPGSLLCDELRKARGTDVEVALKPNGKFSIRSRQGLEFCHAVAQRFRGGGHPNASGGHLRIGALEWPRYWLTGGRAAEADALVAAAKDAVVPR